MQPKIIGEFSSFNSHVLAIILLNQNQENREVQAVKIMYERKMQMTEKKAGKRKVKKKEILTSDHVTVFSVLIGEYCC